MIDHYGYCIECDNVFVFGCMGPFLCNEGHRTVFINGDEHFRFKHGIRQTEIDTWKKRAFK